jgi:hypothetical protein
MTSWTSQDGNTHVVMRNGDHYVVRGTHYSKIS